MSMIRFLKGLLALAVATMAPFAAAADPYPSKPIRMLVGFGAGGTADAIARYYALKMSEILKTPVVVENKPGAAQMIAIKSMQAATPDGYTLFLGTASALSQGPGVRPVAYDPLKDFSLIGLVATAPGVIVITPKLAVQSIGDLVKYAKAHPDTLNYASSGNGAASHLQMEYLLNLTGMKMTHVAYKADVEIMRVLMEGSVHAGISPVQGAMASITTGKVKPLAVTGSKRLKVLPDVPALGESDIKGLEGIDPYSYYGLMGPAGMPPAIVAKLNEAINTVSKAPGVGTHLQERLFAEPGVSTPESFRDYIRKDFDKWKSFAKYVKLPE